MKGFKEWMNSFSVKTVIVLTGIGITLFLAMQQALIGSIASGGNSDIFLMSFSIWLTVMIVVIVFSALLLLIGYLIHSVIRRFKTKRKNKKVKK